MSARIALFCGGVGGAKMAAGLAAVLPAADLQVVVNVGDDFVFCGLHISPDLDTVMYTLAGLNDQDRGWGLRDESWKVSQCLSRLGGPAWFRLGDADLATHLTRTDRLSRGLSLSEVSEELCRAFGVAQPVSPITDAPVRTRIQTSQGLLDFQDYFVRHGAEPAASAILYAGADSACLAPAVAACLRSSRLEAIVLAPSNPWLSIGPMLALPEARSALEATGLPVLAVSPIIGGRAVKGPAAKLMGELGFEVSAYGVAKYYENLITHYVIDTVDAHLADRIRDLGMQVLVTDTLIPSIEQQQRLAGEMLRAVSTGG